MRAAFLGTPAEQQRDGPGARMLPLGKISAMPNQPRRYFSPESLTELTRSVRERGVLQPITVRPLPDGTFALVLGERRLRAAREAGLTQIPAIVRDIGESEALDLALFENTQREDLNPYEYAQATLELISRRMGWPLEDVPARVRLIERQQEEHPEEAAQLRALFAEIGRGTLTNFVKQGLRVLKLPAYLLDELQRGALEYTKVLAISGAPAEHHRELLRAALEEGLSVSGIHARRAKLLGGRGAMSPTPQRVVRLIQKTSFDKLEAPRRERLERLLLQVEQLLQDNPGKGKRGRS